MPVYERRKIALKLRYPLYALVQCCLLNKALLQLLSVEYTTAVDSFYVFSWLHISYAITKMATYVWTIAPDDHCELQVSRGGSRYGLRWAAVQGQTNVRCHRSPKFKSKYRLMTGFFILIRFSSQPPVKFSTKQDRAILPKQTPSVYVRRFQKILNQTPTPKNPNGSKKAKKGQNVGWIKTER